MIEHVLNRSMKNENNTESKKVRAHQENAKPPSDFVIGLVTFLLFLIFMFVWMYFGGTGEVSR